MTRELDNRARDEKYQSNGKSELRSVGFANWEACIFVLRRLDINYRRYRSISMVSEMVKQLTRSFDPYGYSNPDIE